MRRSVPVRTFADWGDPPPGFVEVDFVAHSGTSAAGTFVQTMVLTDIATGWTECVPVVMRAGALALEALQIALDLFPFPLKGVDFDNDGAFMNKPVVDWCRAQGFEVTRSRAYRKNDQAWVEQKNGAIVRRLVGYGRFEGPASAAALARLYAAARLHVNLFQPSFKLREKTRIGARVTKRWHAPATPADRALASGRLDADSALRIVELRMRADPVVALAAIRAAQAELGRRVDQRGIGPVEAEAPSVIDIAAVLDSAARQGERRPIHRRSYRRVKPIPKRPSMLDPHRDEEDAVPTLSKTQYGTVYSRAGSTKLSIRFLGPEGAEVRRSAGTKDVREAEGFLEREYHRTRDLSFQAAAVDFFETRGKELKASTVRGYLNNLRQLAPTFGDKLLGEITKETLKGFVSQRRRQVSVTTIRRDLALLSTVISHAVDHMPGGPEVNPVIAFKKKALGTVHRDRWLTAVEYDRVLQSCWEEMHAQIITIACHTDMRLGELLALRKPMLFLGRGEVLLPGTLTKNGKSRIVPLSDHAVRTLETVCAGAPDDLVFWHRQNAQGEARPYTTFKDFWDGTRRRSRVEDVRFHDLRHTLASWWVQSGGDLYTLQKVLGHSSLQMVQRYAHLDNESTRRAVKALDLPTTFRKPRVMQLKMSDQSTSQED